MAVHKMSTGIGVRRDQDRPVYALSEAELHEPSAYLDRYRVQLRKAEQEDPGIPSPISVSNINRILAYRRLSRGEFAAGLDRAINVIDRVKAGAGLYDKWLKSKIIKC